MKLGFPIRQGPAQPVLLGDVRHDRHRTTCRHPTAQYAEGRATSAFPASVSCEVLGAYRARHDKAANPRRYATTCYHPNLRARRPATIIKALAASHPCRL